MTREFSSGIDRSWKDACFNAAIRHDWKLSEIEEIYTLPLPDLLFRAQTIHRQFHDPNRIQGCQLLSIKTGGCPEDCAYCPQSAHYKTDISRNGLLEINEVLDTAKNAKAAGATRFCMGAAWRLVPDGEQFDQVLEMVLGVRALGLEACCTLGMLRGGQAKRLAQSGLTAYNHNLDTSPEFYGDIITTRTYEDRLETLKLVREAGITVCCGGIIGMGESREDRCELLRLFAAQRPHPESVPINQLVRVKGTPLANVEAVDVFEFVRMIATARVLMPQAMVRLSAGRLELSDEAQALCFLSGANSIFMGEKLLTTPNPESERDQKIFDKLGLKLFSHPNGRLNKTPIC